MVLEEVKTQSKRSQITIFFIFALLLVAAVIIIFLARDNFNIGGIPSNMEPVYNTFLTCLEEETLTGISILESQGGYIELPDFISGSSYMPFSSQLDFFGNAIPYWYYVSGNGIEKEQVPSKSEMEIELGNFIKSELRNCDFENYYDEGFEILVGDVKDIDVDIRDENVQIKVRSDLNIVKGEESLSVGNHDISVSSKIWTLYNSAREVYDYEQDNLFLEDYAIDTLRLYAPVDGVELTCSPLTWNAQEVFTNLRDAIESNTLAIKTRGDDFSLTSEENKYFIKDITVDGDVRFLNSREWVYSFEVSPSEEDILVARPLGANQQGLGILGFCYVPYHYVYDIKYPILVQIFLDDEIFQFPLAVIVQGNNPRKALETSAVDFQLPEICEQKNTEVQVNVYDIQLNPIDKVDVSYVCFGTKCHIGETSSGTLKENFPQCINGDILVKANGYEETRLQYSVVQNGKVDVIADKLYEKNVVLKIDNAEYNGQATISFISDSNTKTIVYPEQKKIELSAGQYEVQVYIYKNSTINLRATSREECIEVPRSGIGGILGLTEDKCFTIEFPSQIISNALSGGGKQKYYVAESELSNFNTIEINSRPLQTPKSIEELQNNYALFEDRGLSINFK